MRGADKVLARVCESQSGVLPAHPAIRNRIEVKESWCSIRNALKSESQIEPASPSNLSYTDLTFAFTVSAADLSLPSRKGTIIGTCFRYLRYASPWKLI